MLVADWVTDSRHITAIAAAMTMIRNSAATKPKPRCFWSGPCPRCFCIVRVRGYGPLLRGALGSGRIVYVDLLQERDGFSPLG